MFDWKAKVHNYWFWIGVSSAVLGIIVSAGIHINSDWVMGMVKGILGLLTLIGVVVNPNTPGIGDNPAPTQDSTEKGASV